MLHLPRNTISAALTSYVTERERIEREATKPRFKVGDKVTDGLIRGTVTQLDPNWPLVGVEFFPWPNERRWDWFSEDRLRLE